MDASSLTPSVKLIAEVELPPQLAAYFGKLARVIEAGVAMEGAPSAYGLVWEYGNRRQEFPGPKTVFSENPLGELEWMSSQAPHGWIAVNEGRMRDVVTQRLSGVDIDGVEEACIQASIDMFNILQETVPMDSGALSNSLALVAPGDDLLNASESDGEMLQDWSDE